jgi:hypothetical protein
MGSSPKQSDYQPSESDKANAAVGKAEKDFFDQNYGPLLRQMRDKSMTQDQARVLRGRANADTMQALTGETSFQGSQRVGAAGDMSQALQGQLGIADRSGLDIQNKMRTNVLGTARGQAADAQTGMAQASRLDTSTALNRARANQEVAQSKLNAGVKLGSTFIGQGLKNKRETGEFFTPGIGQTTKNEDTGEYEFSYRPATSWSERIKAGVGSI